MDALAKKAHFWRRTSFGATNAELNNSVSPAELLEKWLRQPAKVDVPNLGKIEKMGKDRRNQVLKFADWLISQNINAENPLHEKMVSFWRDHFVVSAQKVRIPQFLADYDARLRADAFGDFRELLWSVTTSPAMLVYLDNSQNRSGKINENYSREVMELFTLGRGQYSEKDIQEGARALTGWVIKPDPEAGTAEVLFLPRRHDDGIKTFLGKRGNLKTEDVVDILANHPSTAKTIAHKLWSTFAYPNPESEIVNRLAQVYQQNQRNLKSVVAAMFASPEFYSAKSYRRQLKTPIYFMLGSIRQLGIKSDPIKVLGSLRAMGQVFYNAPTVKGFPTGKAWLTAPSLLTRLNLAQKMIQEYGDDGGFSYNPQNLSTPDLLTLLLDNNAEPSLIKALKDLSPREATALILSSPLYQLA